MKTTRNPWVSISDLLSSVILILLLLFVMAAIVPKYNQAAKRTAMMQQIAVDMAEFQKSGMVEVHAETGMLEFTSMTFDRGSAILSSTTEPLVKELSVKLLELMKDRQQMEILIEGHTDPRPVQNVMNVGGYYENNIQLSTLRAASVRSSLIKYMGKDYENRIGVAGYGETRLKNKQNPYSPENRRVEIRILWNGKEQN